MLWLLLASVQAMHYQICKSPLSSSYILDCQLILPTVSEAIALELRQATGNIYLHAQIFTGFMFIGAACCMWFLRAWKIGELQRAFNKKAGKETSNGVNLESSVANTGLDHSGMLKRLYAVGRV